ncbi:hypothetical protein ES288_A08G100400v1 [Gossypium darwinii]|uniref:Uncharacterized protein n=1 Tax=Gossypium darwinii TaxID=34276 RepID=A0A5D2FM96_GOSDA|nr:hypothetical protein ES288_A08G100400v1 [Gossypium darwinii]
MPPWNSSTKGSSPDLVSGDPTRGKKILFGVGSCSGTSQTSYQLSFPRCSSKSRWMLDIQRRPSPFFSAANVGLFLERQ